MPTQLSQQQIDEANRIFLHIENNLPDKISYPFAIYKILDKITKGPQRMVLDCIKTRLPSTYLKHEQRWNNAFRKSGIIL